MRNIDPALKVNVGEYVLTMDQLRAITREEIEKHDRKASDDLRRGREDLPE